MQNLTNNTNTQTLTNNTNTQTLLNKLNNLCGYSDSDEVMNLFVKAIVNYDNNDVTLANYLKALYNELVANDKYDIIDRLADVCMNKDVYKVTVQVYENVVLTGFNDNSYILLDCDEYSCITYKDRLSAFNDIKL